MRTLVLWDIDHTLLSIGDLSGQIYAEVFEDVTGRPMQQLADMTGRTDRAIITATLRLHGTKALAKRTVKVYFQACGSKKWVAMATVRTDAHGAFTRTFTAKQDGTWHAVFTGDALDLPGNAADYVDVR